MQELFIFYKKILVEIDTSKKRYVGFTTETREVKGESSQMENELRPSKNRNQFTRMNRTILKQTLQERSMLCFGFRHRRFW